VGGGWHKEGQRKDPYVVDLVLLLRRRLGCPVLLLKRLGGMFCVLVVLVFVVFVAAAVTTVASATARVVLVVHAVYGAPQLTQLFLCFAV